MSDIIRAHARLTILRELYAQSNYSLNDSLLRETLEGFGIAKTREWVREELNYLAEVGAIRKTMEGTVVVATLLGKGVEHVERRLTIEGVKRSSPPEG